ncbi:MAG: DUF2163 domain-containing protein [Chthonomonas sp.]|nr:DUF2163 domain-containing protein [Chthonomonas sp.]
MPRSLSPAMLTHIQGDTLTLVRLIEIVRPHDGARFGWVLSDQPVTFDSLVFKPLDGVASSVTQQSAGTGIDNLEFSGVLRDDRISTEHLEAGLYRGATVIDRVVNRLDLAAGVLFRDDYVVGAIQIEDGVFRLELESNEQLLKVMVGDRTQPGCRCSRLGNAQCKFAFGNIGGVPSRPTRTVSLVSSDVVFRVSGDSAPAGFYSRGYVKGVGGANDLIEVQIKEHRVVSGVCEIELRSPMPFAVTVGETVRLEVGCDGAFSTCGTKFGNANNFRGEPYLPGNSLYVRTAE